MKRSRFTAEQIISDSPGTPCRGQGRGPGSTARLLARHAVVWKQRSGTMVVSDAKRLPALEQENARLKRLVAD